MVFKSIVGSACSSISFLLFSGSLFASPVQYSFIGLSSQNTGIFSGASSHIVSGEFRYDTSWPNLTPGAIDSGLYQQTNDFYGIEIIFDGVTYNSKDFVSTHSIDVVNDRPPGGPLFDEFYYVASIGGANGAWFGVDFQAGPTNLDALTSTDLPTTLTYAKFDQAQTGGLRFYDSAGNLESELAFGIGSLTAVVVPVPAAVWLFGSGLIGLIGLARRKA